MTCITLRFQDTKLKIDDFKKIIKIRENNHKVVITAFDNDSISTLQNIDYDFLKLLAVPLMIGLY